MAWWGEEEEAAAPPLELAAPLPPGHTTCPPPGLLLLPLKAGSTLRGLLRVAEPAWGGGEEFTMKLGRGWGAYGEEEEVEEEVAPWGWPVVAPPLPPSSLTSDSPYPPEVGPPLRPLPWLAPPPPPVVPAPQGIGWVASGISRPDDWA